MMSAILPAAVLAVLVRLALRHDTRQETTWVFTAGLTALVAGCVLGTEYVGDHGIDVAASDLFGENISDLLRSVYLVAGCACIGLIALHGIYGEWAPDSLTNYRRRWLITCGVAGIILIVTSRAGLALTVPVSDELELLDVASGIYSATFYVIVAATAALVATASVLTVRLDGWRLVPVATGLVGMLGASSAVVTLLLLLAHREWLAANHAVVATGWALPLVGILAAAGLWGIIRAAIKERAQRA
ncbi:hypothetical protein ACFWPK_33125 [Nocardia sp. NPDC058519]|uniref:hypothetical protein n=1 Tax=Nocardia sp. NPDC058519 TaxID=3346535 RepID=UPI0036531298